MIRIVDGPYYFVLKLIKDKHYRHLDKIKFSVVVSK
jgi:hypothetical protein